jgi:hypothetical protein
MDRLDARNATFGNIFYIFFPFPLDFQGAARQSGGHGKREYRDPGELLS